LGKITGTGADNLKNIFNKYNFTTKQRSSIMTTYQELRESLLLVNEAVAELNTAFAKIKPLQAVNTLPIPELPEYMKMLLDGHEPSWIGTGKDVLKFAFVKVLSINENEVIVEKGTGRYVSKIKKIHHPYKLSDFQVGANYLVKYAEGKNSIEYIVKLDLSKEELYPIAKRLAARAMTVKA
jgi:hypothetical protein